jgi:hypothetical protein
VLWVGHAVPVDLCRPCGKRDESVLVLVSDTTLMEVPSARNRCCARCGPLDRLQMGMSKQIVVRSIQTVRCCEVVCDSGLVHQLSWCISYVGILHMLIYSKHKRCRCQVCIFLCSLTMQHAPCTRVQEDIYQHRKIHTNIE